MATNNGWKLDEKMPEYRDQVERDAYRAGYSDGFYGYRQQQNDWPNSYAKGYWEGHHDGQH